MREFVVNKNTKKAAAGLMIACFLVSCNDNDVVSEPVDGGSTESVEVDSSETSLDYVTSAKGDDRVMPLDKIKIESSTDDLRVTMTDLATGRVINGQYGELDDGGRDWVKIEELKYGGKYRLHASAGGKEINKTLITPKPTTAEPVISPGNGEEVGSAATIAVRFDAPVPDRKKMEESIYISTAPEVEGSFRWISDKEVRWRPAKFWAPGTVVKVNVGSYGKYYGGGIFGGNNTGVSFRISPEETITEVDDKTKTAVVRKRGKVVKTFPVSLGKDSTPTNNGVYILGDHNPSMVMDSSTYGVSVDSAEGYRLNVDYATQMSYSGIYLHSAPWAAGAIGSYNQSHGCINALPEDAKWFMENTHKGDPVIVKNSVGDTLPVDDGLGDWNIPYKKWTKR